jgi:hypothetical protein
MHYALCVSFLPARCTKGCHRYKLQCKNLRQGSTSTGDYHKFLVAISGHRGYRYPYPLYCIIDVFIDALLRRSAV